MNQLHVQVTKGVFATKQTPPRVLPEAMALPVRNRRIVPTDAGPSARAIGTAAPYDRARLFELLRGTILHGPRWYRVEHHADTQVRALDRIADVYAHHTTLSPFRSHLLLEGIEQGELVLIDEATGRIVACCRVRPQRRRTSRRQ
jgi:hypothetical protein